MISRFNWIIYPYSLFKDVEFVKYPCYFFCLLLIASSISSDHIFNIFLLINVSQFLMVLYLLGHYVFNIFPFLFYIIACNYFIHLFIYFVLGTVVYLYLLVVAPFCKFPSSFSIRRGGFWFVSILHNFMSAITKKYHSLCRLLNQ